MKNLARKIVVLFTAILMCVLMAGCVRMNIGVTVKTNGKADVSIMYAISDSMSQYSDSELISDEDIAEYEKKGYKVTPYNEDGYSGVTLLAEDVEISDISGLEGMEELTGKDFLKKDGNNYILDMDIFKSEDMQNSAQYLGMINSSGGYMRFTLTTPVAAKNHNATSVSEDGKTLTWDLLAMNGEPIHAEFTLPSMAWLPILIAAFAIILVVIIAIVIKMSHKKKSGPDDMIADIAADEVPSPDQSASEANTSEMNTPADEAAEAAKTDTEVHEEADENITAEESAADDTVTETVEPESEVAETAEPDESEAAETAEPDESETETSETSESESETKASATVSTEIPVTEQIREYKKLMDDEIITAEEFEKKKQQLLDIH